MNNQTPIRIGREIFPDHLKTLIEQKIEDTALLDAIASVTISPDNQKIAGGGFKTIKVWDFKTGELTYNSQGHSDWVLCLCISQNGWFMASGSADNTINLWNVQNGQCYQTLRGHYDWITVLAMTPDSKTVVSGSVDKTIKVWDIYTGECKYTLTEHSDSISSLAISPDGSFLLSGSADKTIKVWNLKDLKKLKSLDTLSGHLSSVQALSFLENQDFISGSRDGKINIWQAELNQPSLTESNQPSLADSKQSSLTESKQSSLVKLNQQNTVKNPFKEWIVIVFIIISLIGFVWFPLEINVNTKILLSFLISLCGISVKPILFKTKSNPNLNPNPNSNLNPFTNLRASSAPFKYKEVQKFVGKLDKVNAIALYPSNSYIIAGYDKNIINVWDGNKIFSLESQKALINSIAISPDGKTLVSATQDWVILWDLEKTQPTYPLKGQFKPILSQISLVPLRWEMIVGQTQIFELVAVDQNGQKMAIKSEDISWDPTGGNIDSNGLFTAGQVEGEFKITVTVGKFKESASIIVYKPPQLTRLVIQPKHDLRLEFGKTQTFKVQGFDQRGNLMKIDPVKWVCSCGSINEKDEQWIFQAGYNAGNFKIEAIVDNIKDSVNVTIVASPELTILSISPQQIELQMGQVKRFTAYGFDQYGNPISISHITWSATGGYIDKQGHFTAGQQAEIVTITAKAGEISAFADVRIIEPSRLTKLEIEPVKIAIQPKQEKQFTLKGFDQRGQTFSVEKVKWETTGGGKINKNGKFTADSDAKGVFKITATVLDRNITAVAEIVVVPVLRTLYIFPEEIALKPEQSFQFDIAGFDQTDKLFQIDPVTWECTAGGKITQNGTLTVGFEKSEVLITATVNNIKGYAIATVLPVLTQLKIESNANVILYPNTQQAFTAIGLDQYDNPIEVGEIFWEATGGKIDQQGNFTVAEDAKGEYQVTATVTEFPTSKAKQKLLMLGMYMKLIIIFVKYIESLQENWFFKILTDPFSRNLIGKLTDASSTLNTSGEEQQNSASPQESDQTTEPEFAIEQPANTQLESTAELTVDNLRTSSAIDNLQISFNLEEKIQEKLFNLLIYIVNYVADLFIKSAEISASVKVTVPEALKKLQISPKKVEINSDQDITFKILGLDQKNNLISVPEVHWDSTSGTISTEGKFKPEKNSSGQVIITAFVENITDSAVVTVNFEEIEEIDEELFSEEELEEDEDFFNEEELLNDDLSEENIEGIPYEYFRSFLEYIRPFSGFE